MPHYNSKVEERTLLLREFFFYPYPGRPLDRNPLFRICRELGSSYCLGFDEHGYTGSFKGFDSEKVID